MLQYSMREQPLLRLPLQPSVFLNSSPVHSTGETLLQAYPAIYNRYSALTVWNKASRPSSFIFFFPLSRSRCNTVNSGMSGRERSKESHLHRGNITLKARKEIRPAQPQGRAVLLHSGSISLLEMGIVKLQSRIVQLKSLIQVDGSVGKINVRATGERNPNFSHLSVRPWWSLARGAWRDEKQFLLQIFN